MRQTPIAIKNVTPYVLASPVGIDLIVKSLQERFSNNLSWLAKSFNRAVITSNVGPNGDRYESAKCFIADGSDELDMIVNDNWSSYCFFLSRDSETVIEYRSNQDSLYERELSIYFWFNMDEVDPTKDYPYLEELKREIESEIRSAVFFSDTEIEIEEIIDDPLSVFDGFTVDVDKTQLLYNPYSGLRFDLNCVYSSENQCDIPLAAPSDFAFSNPTSSTLDATITSNSGSAEDGFEWYISEDNISFSLNGTTSKNVTSYQYTGLDPDTLYYGKALAYGLLDSVFSNTDTSTTLPAGLLFVSNWNTENAGTSNTDEIALPLEASGTYNFNVIYEGGIIKTITSHLDNVVVFPDGAGIKEISISGVINGFAFNDTGDKSKILSITDWGDLILGNSGGYFRGCNNLTGITSANPLNQTGLTSLSNAFRDTTSMTTPPENIDYSSISNFAISYRNSGITSFTGDMSSSTNISQAFRDSDVVTVTLTNTDSVTIWQNAFENSNLTSINFTMRGMTAANNCFIGTVLNTTDYSNLLIDLEANNPNSNWSLHGGGSKYNAAGGIARASLVARPCTITDGGAA